MKTAERRTKIVATTGPATDSDRQLSELIRAGADCLRFNLSHGAAAEHVARIRRARAAARRIGRHVAVLVDLCGPKIRTGLAPKEGVRLQRGTVIEILPRPVESTPRRIGISYAGLAREIRPGQRILLADGRMELLAERVSGGRILARVKTGGVLTSRKGVNLPGANLSVPAMTAKDRSDLAAAAAVRPDYVALSFVRSAADLRRCRRAMNALGLADAGLIAKIETPEAVAVIDEVMAECEGVMVARGDLGVEMDPVEVPTVQRMLVERAARSDRLCIVATEMFESMIENPRPTRAEVSDVA
ncbi:MAG TPA: pyruvate kinase, partial [Planctomycetota bacterium]|nr:pyruvate kinase [Planctomycetota bacterium]